MQYHVFNSVFSTTYTLLTIAPHRVSVQVGVATSRQRRRRDPDGPGRRRRRRERRRDLPREAGGRGEGGEGGGRGGRGRAADPRDAEFSAAGRSAALLPAPPRQQPRAQHLIILILQHAP